MAATHPRSSLIAALPRRRLLAQAALLATAPLVLSTRAAHAGDLAPTPAPDFALRRLDGPAARLSEMRGQVVMLNFWATWCAPCREEMPQLAKLHDRYRASGFALWGVNIDEQPRNAESLVAQLGVKFPVLHDADKAVSKMYRVNAMPSTVLVDREGRMRYLHEGYRAGDEREYDAQIRRLIKE